MADEVMTRIGQVVMLLYADDREEARTRFAGLWEEAGDKEDPFHRCALAHFMAGAQDDPEDALEGDLRALRVAQGTPPGPGRRAEGPEPSAEVRAFFPSLHLSLAGDYWEVGERALARDHLARAREASQVLGDDPYEDGIRAGIRRMEIRPGESGQLP